MIVLPNVIPHEKLRVQEIPSDIERLLIYSVLQRGLKLFREDEFICRIPKERERDYSVLHMSSIGHCGRKEFLRLKDTQTFDDLEQILRNRIPPPYLAWHMGHIIETYTLHILKLGGLPPFDMQRKVSDLDRKITGSIDGLVKIGTTNYLIEIKGLRHESVDLLPSYGVKKAIPAYYAQMQYYMYCLKVNAGYFLALDKDTNQWYIEYVRFDGYHISFLQQKVLALHSLQNIEDIPKEYVIYECRFCPLLEKCFNLEGEEQFLKNFTAYEEQRRVNN